MLNKKNAKREKLYRHFGSRKVFFVHTACLLITLVTMVVNIILTFAARVYTPEKLVEHFALCVLAVALLNIPVFMRAKLRYNIPAFIHIVAAIFIIAHCVLGEVYRIYDRTVVFDKLLHTTAGIVIAILGFSVVYGFSKQDSRSVRLSPAFVAGFSFCFALALLVLWELFEYGMDSLFGMNMQRYKDSLYQVVDSSGVVHTATTSPQGNGLIDSMMDLVVGALGAFLVCVVGGILLKKYPDSTKFYITRKTVVIAGSFTKHESHEPPESEEKSEIVAAVVVDPVANEDSTADEDPAADAGTMAGSAKEKAAPETPEAVGEVAATTDKEG